MPCTKPRTGWESRWLTPSGKRKTVFKELYSNGLQRVVKCGQCIGCRLDYSRQWALRCWHEASLWYDNSFVTLTYSDENLTRVSSGDPTLVKRDHVLFMKKLRKRFVGTQEISYFDEDGNVQVHRPIRFYNAGEYGDQTSRPHFHTLLFNFDFPDKVVHKRSKGGTLYTSQSLSELWGLGHAYIGTVTFSSAAYVARYIMKKVNGKAKDEHYSRIDYDTGVVDSLQPEYCTMSRRPGIGRLWFDKFKDDLFPQDFAVYNGKKMKVPSYYDRLLEKVDPEMLFDIKTLRKLKAEKHLDNNTEERLAVREAVQKARLNLLIRDFE